MLSREIPSTTKNKMSFPLVFRSQLTTLYCEPHRHYHNLAHIQHCWREWTDYMEWEQREEELTGKEQMIIEYAIWFHDAIYDPYAHTGQNEKESAELAANELWKLGDIYRDIHIDVYNMIMLTANHEDAETLAQKVFLDIDLAILGARPELYDRYAENIRKEYSLVEQKQYAHGRTRILQGILKFDRIYHTTYFHQKYEAQARENIQKEITQLSLWL